MKRDPNTDYTKPPEISDFLRKDLIYEAIEHLSRSGRTTRVADIAEYLNDKHEDIEFDPVSTARNIFEMGRKVGWRCEIIEGALYPVCLPSDMLQEYQST